MKAEKIEPLSNKEESEIKKSRSRLLTKAKRKFFESKDNWVQDTLEKFATPPLKKPITAGKLKYRRIELIVNASTGENYIIQRGEKIGESFIEK